MIRPIEIHEINEFSEVEAVSSSTINNIILSNVKELYEKREIEPFIREILCDPDETPHCATEMADILTHVHVKDNKVLAAFVLKGKSYKNVTSKGVAHQYLKLRRIQGVDLMVLGAVGVIQDDAKSDFVQTAKDAKCDYLIINSVDLARLFIAYGKICPEDGTPYNETGVCRNGHERREKLEVSVEEKVRYEILNQKDVSHVGAKRYSAIVLLSQLYTAAVIRDVVKGVTEELRSSNYYRNKMVQERWGETPAHVVWLYIAFDFRDIQNANWICRTCWIDEGLSDTMRPSGLKGNDKIDDIEIHWNESYKEQKEFFESHYGTKEQMVEINRSLLKEMGGFAQKAIECFQSYKSGRVSEERLISEMQEMEPKINELYEKSGNIPFSPPDCADYDEACQNIYSTIHDMFLYYTKRGLETWPKSNREWLMQDTIKRFYDDWKRIKFEESKIH